MGVRAGASRGAGRVGRAPIVAVGAWSRPRLTEPGGYGEFPNVARRNAAQAALEVPTLVRALDLPPAARMLEIGCGRGIALAPLARLCAPARMVGLDIDGELLVAAHERLAARAVRAELVVGDVRDMPFPDASFDIVIDFGTCYHVARRSHALREIARVLEDDGLFVHETPLSQLLAHPLRSGGRRLPWAAAPALVYNRGAVLWSSRVKASQPPRRDGLLVAGARGGNRTGHGGTACRGRLPRRRARRGSWGTDER